MTGLVGVQVVQCIDSVEYGITDLLETRQVKGYSTVLRKIRAHTHIRGNDLADTAAKLAVTDFDTLPGENTLRVEVGSIAPRPPLWVMYTANPQTPPPDPRYRAETCHSPPAMVDNPRDRAPPDARIHSPLDATTPTC